MAKHKDGFPGIYSRIANVWLSSVVVVCVAGFGVHPGDAVAQQAPTPCAAVSQDQADKVFNQAFTTVSNLSNAAVRAKDRGQWRPDGSFRRQFFGQAGRSLSTIRGLLDGQSASVTSCTTAASSACSTSEVPKAALLSAFEAIFSVPLPKGLRGLRRLQRVELEKFKSILHALPATYVTCS
jgi:hypothetical protein